MNQIKYILSACLILLIILMGIFLYKTFPESGIKVQNPATAANSSSQSVMVNSKGQQLFRQNCASCHALNKDLIGPALAKVLDRGPWVQDKKNIYAWVHNPQEFMSKDPYTKALRAKFGVTMTSFPNLMEKEIDDILDYIESGGSELVVD